MRINKYVALCSHLSRRKADQAIEAGLVTVNGEKVNAGYQVRSGDSVTLAGQDISLPDNLSIVFNKPPGYVVSRNGQGSQTIYELLPEEYQQLNPVGRLDKASSGLLILTNDGELSQKLTHPSQQKNKVYQIELYMPLTNFDRKRIEVGIKLDDGVSKLKLDGHDKQWQVTMSEGRNRQIRRTFGELGYTVNKLHRTQIGDIELDDLEPGKWKLLGS